MFGTDAHRAHARGQIFKPMAQSAKPTAGEQGPVTFGHVRSALRQLGRVSKNARVGYLLDQVSSSLAVEFLPTQHLPKGWSAVPAEDLAKRFLAVAAPVSIILRTPWKNKSYNCVQAIGKDFASACRTLLELDGNTDQDFDFVKFWCNRKFQVAIGDVGLPTRREGGKVVKANQVLDTGHILLPCSPSLTAAGFAERDLFTGKVAQLLRVILLKTRRGDPKNLAIMTSFLMIKRGWSHLGIPSLVKTLVGHQADLTREPEPLTAELSGAIRDAVHGVLRGVQLDKDPLQKVKLPLKACASTCGVDGGANAAIACLLGPVLTANVIENSTIFAETRNFDDFTRRSTIQLITAREKENRELLKARGVRLNPDVLKQFDVTYGPEVNEGLPPAPRMNLVQIDSMENSAKREVFDKIETARQLLSDVIEPSLLINYVTCIAEDCKFRIITAGNALVNASLATLHGHLQKCWAATPYYTGPGWEQRVLEWAPVFSIKGELFIWHSVDYKSATDNLNRWSTHAASEAVLEFLSEYLPEDFKTFLGGATIVYPKDKSIEKYFKWTKNAAGQNVPPLLKESILQTNGQLMGHVLSFPLLCMINLATLQLANKRAVAEGLMSQEDSDKVMSRVLINGDDLLFAAPAWFVAYWEKVATSLGLTTTVGKSFSSPTFAMVNNVFYSMVSDPLQWKTGKRNQIVGYLNQAIIYGKNRGVQLEELSPDDLEATSPPSNYLGRTFREMAERLPVGLASEYLDGFLRASPWPDRFGSRIVVPHPRIAASAGGLGLLKDQVPERWNDPKSVGDVHRALAGASITGRASSLYVKDAAPRDTSVRSEILRKLPKPWPVIDGLPSDSPLHKSFLTTQRLESDGLLIHCDCGGVGPFDPETGECPEGGTRCDTKLSSLRHDLSLRVTKGSAGEKTFKSWKQACVGTARPTKHVATICHLKKESVAKMLEIVPLTAEDCLSIGVTYLYPVLPRRMPNAHVSFIGSGVSLKQVSREFFPGTTRFEAYAQSFLFPNAFALPIQLRKIGVHKTHRHKLMQSSLWELGSYGRGPDEGLDGEGPAFDRRCAAPDPEHVKLWNDIHFPLKCHRKYVLGKTGLSLEPGRKEVPKDVTVASRMAAEQSLDEYTKWCLSRPVSTATPLGLPNLGLPVQPPYRPVLEFGDLGPCDIVSENDILPGGRPPPQRPNEPFLLARKVTPRRRISERRLEKAQIERFGPLDERWMDLNFDVLNLQESAYIGHIGSNGPAVPGTSRAFRMGSASFVTAIPEH